MLGGFIGSGIVYANYISAIDFFEGHNLRTVPPAPNATAGIFCTYPQAFVTKTSQLFSESIASALLMFVIFALKDPCNNGYLPSLSFLTPSTNGVPAYPNPTNGFPCASSSSSSVWDPVSDGKLGTQSTLRGTLDHV